MKSLIVFDPGMASGVFWGHWSDTMPLVRVGYRQIPGGLEGLIPFLRGIHHDTVVSEKFAPRPNGGRQFKLEELEPIRIEGVLRMVFGERVVWQTPGQMVLASGSTQAERKKNSDDVLRRNGWWLTGKDVGLADANDANAAAKHALAYMRSIGHVPSIEAYLV